MRHLFCATRFYPIVRLQKIAKKGFEIFAALNLERVVTKKEWNSKLELNKCTNWWSYSSFSYFSQWGDLNNIAVSTVLHS